MLIAASCLLVQTLAHSCADELLPLCESLDSPGDRIADQNSPGQCIAIPTVSVSFSNTAAVVNDPCGFALTVTAAAVNLDSYSRFKSRIFEDTVNEATYKADATNFETSATNPDPLMPKESYVSGMPQTYHVLSSPILSWEHDAAKYYTLLMVDAGTASEYNATPCDMQYLNWLVMNIPGSNVAGGDEIVSYFGPTNHDLEKHL